MKTMVKSWLVAAVLAVLAASAFGMARRPAALEHPLVLVVPARMRVLQAALDVQSLRAVVLFAYQVARNDGKIVLHKWEAGAWQAVGAEAFEDYLRALPPAASITAVGGPGVMPEAFRQQLAALRPETKFLASLAPAELFNTLDPVCRFSAREWHWLAERYQLQLTDENAPLREFNPYAVRRSQLPIQEKDFPVDSDDALVPAEMEKAD